MSARFLEEARKVWPQCCDVQEGGYYYWSFEPGKSCGDSNPCGQHAAIASALSAAHARGVEEGIEEAAMIVASKARYITSEGVPRRLAAAIRRALRPDAGQKEGGE